MAAGLLPGYGNALALAFFTSCTNNLFFAPIHSALMRPSEAVELKLAEQEKVDTAIKHTNKWIKYVKFGTEVVIAFSFLIIPMLDVIRVVIHRLRNGKNPFLPDRNHIHHKFIALGLSLIHILETVPSPALSM